MKSFLEHIKEEVLPSVQVADGGLDIEKPAVRAAINAAIAGVVSQPAITPYVVFNRLSKLLAQYHIVLPKKFLEGDRGVEVFEIRQFGHKMGMTDSGEFINQVPTTHYLFLQYGIITPMGVTYAKPLVGGMFRVTARLVDKAELDKLLDMAEITMAEEAECRQMAAKAMAPKDPMHDVTSDPKKVGNKKAVATSEKKSLDEAPETMGDVAKSREGHPNVFHDQDSVSYKASADRMKSGSPAFDPHRTEIKRVDEERKRTASVADAFLAGKSANQRTLRTDGKSVTYHGNTIASHEGDHVHVTTAGYGSSPSTRGHVNGILSRLGSPKLSVRKGQLHHGDTPIGSKDVIKVKKPEKATFSEDKGPCWKGYEMVGMKKKGGKPVPNCVPVKEENLDELYGKGSLPGIAAYHTKKSAESKEQMEKTRSGNKKLPVPKKVTDKVSAKDSAAKYHASQAKRAKGMMEEETLAEKAPPGAKYERMVQHIKDRLSKDGLTKKEKSIAFATAWKARNREKGE